MPSRPVVIILALQSACLAGCVGKGAELPKTDVAAEATAGTLDPCALLTADEVQGALGWTVAKSSPYVTGDLGHCTYESEKSNTVIPVEQVEVGVIACFTNFPCPADMPERFASSAEMTAFRTGLYQDHEKTSSMGDLGATITPIEGIGYPAIMHELGGQYSLELQLAPQRTLYVSVWTSADAARSLGEKALPRAK